MASDELKKLCKFSGKAFNFPDEDTQELACVLSDIELHVCDMLTDRELMPGEDLRQVFDDYVAAMIGKWHPFECNELWELYSSR